MKKLIYTFTLSFVFFSIYQQKILANSIIYSYSSSFSNWTVQSSKGSIDLQSGKFVGTQDGTDQWLFSPSIYLESGKEYIVSYIISPTDMGWDETLYAYIGTTPNASSMVKFVGSSQYNISHTCISSPGCAYITVCGSGMYNIGIHDVRNHYISDPPYGYFKLYNFKVIEINNSGINPVTIGQNINFNINNWTTLIGRGLLNYDSYHFTFSSDQGHYNDQWLFSPAIKLYKGVIYKIMFTYTNGSGLSSSSGDKSFSIGNAPSPCTMGMQWSTIGKSNSNSISVQINYTPPISGAFYLGWHDSQYGSIQPGPSTRFSISNLSIELLGCIWTGTYNENWDNPSNWYQYTKPQSNDNAIITSEATNFPIVSTSNTIKNLVITSGASIIGEEHLTITGTTTCYRDIDVGKWHLVSSPIHGATASIFKPATGNGYLRGYNNGVGWGGYFSSPYSQLATGVGYAVYLENKITATVSGNLNSGNITRSLTKGSNGWNLLGNPFASGLDFGQLNLSNAHLETNSVYFWNQSYAESNNGNYMVYNVTSGVGTSGATSVISPFQGFFVKIAYNGSLELSNTARTHNLNAFYKSNSNTQLVTRLKISNSQGFKDEMLVCINDSSNNTYEAYDSEKLLAETNTPEIFAYASGGEKLTIDAINSYPAIIPLSVISPQSGILTLTAFDFSSFDPSVNIMLYDNQTSTIIDLRTQPSYTFSSDTGENNNRFFLHIGNTTGVNETVNNSFVSIRCEDKSINITPFGGEKIMKIEIIDPTGKLLNSVKANGNEITTIPANYTTGIYLIRIYGNHKMMTQKILLH